MASMFFPQESDSLAADATFDSAWRSIAVGAQALTPFSTFNAQVSSSQAGTAWIEFSDDGSTVLGQTAPSNIGPEMGPVGLTIAVCAEYFRVAVNNPVGNPTASVTVKGSFNG